MKVGLYGIRGVYNFGCEAIVRGACKFIHKLYPDAEIIYFSYNYDYDVEILKNLELKVEEIVLKDSILKKIRHRIKRKLNMEQCGFYFDVDSVT